MIEINRGATYKIKLISKYAYTTEDATFRLMAWPLRMPRWKYWRNVWKFWRCFCDAIVTERSRDDNVNKFYLFLFDVTDYFLKNLFCALCLKLGSIWILKSLYENIWVSYTQLFHGNKADISLLCLALASIKLRAIWKSSLIFPTKALPEHWLAVRHIPLRYIIILLYEA